MEMNFETVWIDGLGTVCLGGVKRNQTYQMT